MSFSIPFHPNYEQLRKQAKDLLKACGKGDSSALGLLVEHHPKCSGTSPDDAVDASLSDVQLALSSRLSV